MAPEARNRTFTFWGMVGVVMMALKLKDRWDDCKSYLKSLPRIILSYFGDHIIFKTGESPLKKTDWALAL